MVINDNFVINVYYEAFMVCKKHIVKFFRV